MAGRSYYNQRIPGPDGKPPSLTLAKIRLLVRAVFETSRDAALFDELLGKRCPDGPEAGFAGEDPGAFIFAETWIDDAFPISDFLKRVNNEADLFAIIEFLGDHASSPIQDDEAHFHSWNGCGFHYKNFDRAAGRGAWTARINPLLQVYGDGFELNDRGEIHRLGEPGLREIFEAKLPASAHPTRVSSKVEDAVRKYRRGRSTPKERREAVRELADVLESLRKDAKTHLLSKDESDLFNIANNFAIRHNNDAQKTDYDPIWLAWLFYLYLATIHLLLHLNERAASPNQRPAG